MFYLLSPWTVQIDNSFHIARLGPQQINTCLWDFLPQIIFFIEYIPYTYYINSDKTICWSLGESRRVIHKAMLYHNVTSARLTRRKKMLISKTANPYASRTTSRGLWEPVHISQKANNNNKRRINLFNINFHCRLESNGVDSRRDELAWVGLSWVLQWHINLIEFSEYSVPLCIICRSKYYTVFFYFLLSE